jgi:DNA-binding MarR family transcriptional regulator
MAAATDHAPLDKAVAALREVILAGEHYRDVAAGYLGLTISESRAVSYLYARDRMGQTELGEHLGFNTSTVTAIIDRLENHAVAERLPHPTDRRRYTVQLTARGQQMMRESQEWLSHAFDNIDPQGLRTLGSGLTVVAENLRVSAATVTASQPPTARPGSRRRH